MEFTTIISLLTTLLDYTFSRWGLILTVVMAILYVELTRLNRKKNRKGSLSWYEWVYVAILFPPAAIIDVLLNVVFATVVFVDLPKKPTLSKRIDRYLTDKKYHDGSLLNRWRLYIAKPAGRWLNKHDNDHVGEFNG